MHKQLVKVAMGGIAIPRTDMASVEKFLVDKVKAELGETQKFVRIIPVLRVDKEDGDLSGNVSDGFGNVMLDIEGVKVHLPFIIHQKQLIPFDVIRMGEQEVSYNQGKLQKLVNAILIKKKEAKSDDGFSFSFGEVVDPKKTSSANGFLGTIMSTRDEEASRGGGGGALIPFTGPEFGVLDDDRLDRYAQDVFHVYHDCMEKLSAIKSYDKQTVESFVSAMEKKAYEETRTTIEAVKNVEPTPETFEDAAMKRNFSQLEKEKLADVRRAASGNNIEFPVVQNGMLEFRQGRVYHNIVPMIDLSDKMRRSTIKSIVIDSKHQYKIIGDNQPFMMTARPPKPFRIYGERMRGLKEGNMYAIEISETELSHPFVVNYLMSEKFGPDTPRSFRFAVNIKDTIKNTIFSEAFDCEEVMPVEMKDGEYKSVYRKPFKILIISMDTNKLNGVRLNKKQIYELIEQLATDPHDAKAARELIGYAEDYWLFSGSALAVKMEKNIFGFFKKQDGFFSEGPLVKQAAYNRMNYARLIVQKDSKPRVYAVEWVYGQNQNIPEQGANAVQLQKRMHQSLSEDVAKKLLTQLGYNNQNIQLFFDITKRNGREAKFPLPDLAKASMIAPQDVSKASKEGWMRGIVNSTLNASNFVSPMEDVVANTASHIAEKILLASHNTAFEMEKIANEINKASWHEVTALLNLKFHLDKMAAAIESGSYLFHAKDALEKVATLKPTIAKYAKQLISMNRKQLFDGNTPLVSPKLLKSAVEQLDGLYKYACYNSAEPLTKIANDRINQQIIRVSNDALDMYVDYTRIKHNMAAGQPVSEEDKEKMKRYEQHLQPFSTGGDKKKITKEANFAFGVGAYRTARKNAVLAEEAISQSKKNIYNLQKDIDDLSVKIRVERDPSKAYTLTNERDKLMQSRNEAFRALQSQVQDSGASQQILQNTNDVLMLGVGVPAVAAATYGFQHLKDQEHWFKK